MSRDAHDSRFNPQSATRNPQWADAHPDPLSELATVTGGLAHEIRNPLSTLKVNLQLLAEDWRELVRGEEALAEPIRRSLQRIETMLREVDRLARIMDDFLRFAGHHELKRRPIDLNEFVRDTLDLLTAPAAQQSVEMRMRLASDPIIASVDADLLKQALWNLLLNGLHAMPSGGVLEISTRVPGTGERCIDVRDTGCGIPDAQLPKIFDAYYSTRKGGTGLGLPTARRIVAEHGGRIEVTSKPGNGSIFSIVLPADDSPSNSASRVIRPN